MRAFLPVFQKPGALEYSDDLPRGECRKLGHFSLSELHFDLTLEYPVIRWHWLVVLPEAL